MKEKLKFIFSNIWDFLLPKLKLLLSKSGVVIIDIALMAVKTAAASDLSSEQKRQLAVSYAKNQLSTKGIEIGTSMLNSLIEDAYQKIRR